MGFFVASLIVLAAAGWWLIAPYVTSAAFLLDLSGSTSGIRRWLPVRLQAVATRDLDVPTRHGAIPARLYQPAAPDGRSIIVFPGVHAGGVDEPRLVAFSRRLAATGLTVLSVPLPELRVYRITPVATDMIEDATAWMAADRALAPRGRVAMAGVSFAGGLALVAAGRPALRDKVQMVVSLGGHADLPRTMTYLCTGILPDGTARPPHDYGVDVILLGAVERVVPPDQVEPLRHVVRTFLDASSEFSTDQAKAAQAFEEARQQAGSLLEPARTLMQWVNDRNTAALGQRLLPFVEALGGNAALSPDRSPATLVPVFLVHGIDDNVIPSSETPLAAQYLMSHGNSHVEWVLTPFLSHATVSDRMPLGDAWKLVRFWKDVLAAAN